MSAREDYQDKLKEGINAFNNEDYSHAIKLLLPLAESGNAQAQCYIASLYQGGLGVQLDANKAIKWYLKAGNQEQLEGKVSAIAYNNLGTIYSSGLPGVAVDIELAKQYWRKAVDLGFDMIPEEWIKK